MKKLSIFVFLAVLLFPAASFAAPSMCTVTGTAYKSDGSVAASTNIEFRTLYTQTFGNDTVVPSATTVTTSSLGVIPALTQFPQSAHMNVTIGRDKPIVVTMPNGASCPVTLGALIAANQGVLVTPLLADVNAGGFRITNLGANTTLGDALSQGQSHLSDLATANANYSMGGFKFTNLGVGTTSGDSLAFGLNHLNDLATATGNYSMGTNRLTSVATATTTGDALSEGRAIGAVTPATGTFTGLTGSGTGAASNNFSNNGVLNVKSYGAVGDCSTDDTTAIQATITAASNGQTVYFPRVAACYKITAALTTGDKSIAFRGDGWDVQILAAFANAAWNTTANYAGSVIKQATAATGGINITTTSWRTPVLRDLAIIGPGAGSSTGLIISHTNSARVDQVFVGNFSTGIDVQNSFEGEYSNVRLEGNTTGLTDTVLTTNQNVFLNLAVDYATTGVNWTGATDTDLWRGGLIQHVTTNGFVLTDCSNCEISGMHFENSTLTGDGLQLNTTGSLSTNLIMNNRFSCVGCTNDIHITGGGRALLIGNRPSSKPVTIDAAASNTMLLFNNIAGGYSNASTSTVRIDDFVSGGFGLGLNNGTVLGSFLNGATLPTVSACGTGTVGALSTNTAGRVTATGATSCTVVFATDHPFGNGADCVVTDYTTANALKVTTPSTLNFTVSGLTAGDVFGWICIGH